MYKKQQQNIFAIYLQPLSILSILNIFPLSHTYIYKIVIFIRLKEIKLFAIKLIDQNVNIHVKLKPK